MQHDIHAAARVAANAQLTDVTIDHAKTSTDAARFERFVEIFLATRGEIVEPDYSLTERKETLEQIRPDETSYTGDQPGARVLLEGCGRGLVGGHAGSVTSGGTGQGPRWSST